MNIDQILNSSDDGDKAKRLNTNDDQTEQPIDEQARNDAIPSGDTHENFNTSHRASWPDIRKRKHPGTEGDKNHTDSRWRPSNAFEDSPSSRNQPKPDFSPATRQGQHSPDTNKHHRHSVHSISTRKPIDYRSQSSGDLAAAVFSSDSTSSQQRDFVDSKELLGENTSHSNKLESFTASGPTDGITSSSSTQNAASNYGNVESSTTTASEDSERKSRSKRSKAKNSQWTFEEDHKLVCYFQI